MKTTVDIPDDILERTKIAAVRRRTSIKNLIIEGLEAVLREDAPADDTEAFVAAFSRGNNTDSPVGKVHRHEIYDRPILHRL
ncbi:MAG: hypothetical protein B9S38_17755 [Verrucomicrobiia bacterium Tous-C4TDCM]|nr:MAG: hypothetical protein B9S38_17755 [Verrucomicrobiae bacterium Tous-C4TDCM]